MAARVQKQKPAPQETKQVEHVEHVVDEAAAQALKDEMDAMLDEIDAVLEVNAEEFVKGFIQKGGE